MDEKDYELLLDLNETKNITKTASRLFLTQPAITKHSIWRKYHSLCERNPIKYQSSKRAGSGQPEQDLRNPASWFFLKLFPLPASYYFEGIYRQVPGCGCPDYHRSEQAAFSAFKPG